MYRVRIVIFVFALLPVLVSLGVWQLNRYGAKLDIEESFHSRRTDQFTLQDLQGLADPRFYPLTLTGRFDNTRYFLLDNRILQGRVGFHALSPFLLTSGETVLVDRGWVAGIPDRSRLPDVPVVEGLVTVAGQSWQPAGEAFLLEKNRWNDGWPKVIQAIDQPDMAKALDVAVQPWLLILDRAQPGILQRNFAPTNMPANRHLGYAIQWFAMALALVMLGAWAIRHDKNSCGKNNNNITKNNPNKKQEVPL